jgi:hypothetical protein
MWTAQLQEIRKDANRPLAIVLFTDGVKYKRIEPIDLTNLSATAFRARIESLRKGFEDSFTFIDSLTVDFDLTPPPVSTSTPTLDEIAQSALMAKRVALNAALQDFTVKLIDQATYDAQVAAILKS